MALDHGLSIEEWEKITETLGRKPNVTELGVYSAMWNEHCSYKSSRIHLKKFPTQGPHVLQGPGENAGVVDLGEGMAVAFKMESHNHPSFIEPYQGAATGVGGILRDIFTMGARPIALLDSLRFGAPEHPRTPYLVGGVVGGIAGYGNCVGVPTVGGETKFHPCYNGNILVNVMCVGIMRSDAIFRGTASGLGNPVIYVGAPTGRDGIHGASMASAGFDDSALEKRPTVQVGDPFREKLLLEACLELMKCGAVVGIQDMGAAGLTSSSVEMAGRAGTGLLLRLDAVPCREDSMTPYEMMLSESQERMLLVAEKGRESEVREIFERWDLPMSVVGEVTGDGRLRAAFGGDEVADLPVSSLTDDAPTYDRPRESERGLPPDDPLHNLPEPEDLGCTLLKMLAHPNHGDKKPIWRQYDYKVRTNTLNTPGGDAAIMRLKGTNKALALTTDGNARYGMLDPYKGGMLAVAEAARNICCVGARPLAITNCLNFGNPERPSVMAQFSLSIEGMAQACRFLGLPVVSGNVSFYNETHQVDIYPTPIIGMVGLLDDVQKRTGHGFVSEDDVIALVHPEGEAPLPETCAHEYIWLETGLEGGEAPAISMEAEKAVQTACRRIIEMGLVRSAHDLSEGGLGIALAESALASLKSGLGAEVRLPEQKGRTDGLLYGEASSRILVSVPPQSVNELQETVQSCGAELTCIGRVRGDAFIVKTADNTYLINLPMSKIVAAWSGALSEVF
ncbi:MAG: phosphoribosylformylglycinamidine synthase subunit PurL [Nitrospinae bacterium]|nr:phosphoribosylformylglycinamidine synthase subunit PurL [Nitrospinota bacterium]